MTGDRRRWRIPAHVKATRVEGSYVLVDLRAGRYFALDPVGSIVWAALSGDRPVEDAVDRLTREYTVAEDRAAADVAAFVDRLADAGLVEASEPKRPG